MNRREFALGLAGTGSLSALLATPAWAQGEPQEGRQYVRVGSPQPVPAGKVEVVEFFGYWCPHCYSFEPFLEAWARKLPPDVAFRRIPVVFVPPHEPYQKIGRASCRERVS
jgi:thiol:disulfide interchange protein DsbA